MADVGIKKRLLIYNVYTNANGYCVWKKSPLKVEDCMEQQHKSIHFLRKKSRKSPPPPHGKKGNAPFLHSESIQRKKCLLFILCICVKGGGVNNDLLAFLA